MRITLNIYLLVLRSSFLLIDLSEFVLILFLSAYPPYRPQLSVKLGSKHPDPVVESSSLSSVVPPEVHYQLTLPDEVIDRGCLSALQLEAVVYACQRHECILPNGQRAGFLIGEIVFPILNFTIRTRLNVSLVGT